MEVCTEKIEFSRKSRTAGNLVRKRDLAKQNIYIYIYKSARKKISSKDTRPTWKGRDEENS